MISMSMPQVFSTERARNRSNIYSNAAWIAMAAVLWGMDSVVRAPLASRIDARHLVFYEFLIGWVCVAPLALIQERRALFSISPKQIAKLAFLGIVATTFATFLFAIATKNTGSAVASAVQMIQPLFVAAGGVFFLKEKKYGYFATLAVLGVINATFISVPSMSFSVASLPENSNVLVGISSSFAAMLLWGAATLFGKSLLKNLAPITVVFWRWTFGLFSAMVVLKISGASFELLQLTQASVLAPTLVIGAVAGSFAMLLYYQGLKALPASLVTFVELLYPVTGLMVSVFVMPERVSGMQMFGGIMVASAILLMLKMENDLAKR